MAYIPYTDDDIRTITERTRQAGYNPTEQSVRETLYAKHEQANRERNARHQAASDARVPDIRRTGIRDTFIGPDGSRMRNWQFPERPLTESGMQFAAAVFQGPPGARGFQPLQPGNPSAGAPGTGIPPAAIAESAAREAVNGGPGGGSGSRVNLSLASNLKNGGVVLPRANVGGTNMPVTPGYLGANYTGAGISPAELHAQNMAKAEATNSRGPIAGRRMSREERMAQDANRTQQNIAAIGNNKPINTERGVYDPVTGQFHSEPVVGFGSGQGAIREGSGFVPYGPDGEAADAYRNTFSGTDNPEAITRLLEGAGMDTSNFYQTFTDQNGEYQGLSKDGQMFIQFYDMYRSLPGMEKKTPQQIAENMAKAFPEMAKQVTAGEKDNNALSRFKRSRA